MFLYKLTCNVTGKAYIGATRTPIQGRIGRHLNAALREGRTYDICEAIRKHGIENFTLKIIAQPSDYKTLMDMEAQAILEYDTLRPNGYNMTSGGVGTKSRYHSQETKNKIAAKAFGRIGWNKGLKCGPLSAEHRAKISSSQKGREAWNKGIPTPMDIRLKMRGPRSGKPVIVNGISYNSLTAAVRAIPGMSMMKIRYRLEKGDPNIRFADAGQQENILPT